MKFISCTYLLEAAVNIFSSAPACMSLLFLFRLTELKRSYLTDMILETKIVLMNKSPDL